VTLSGLSISGENLRLLEEAAMNKPPDLQKGMNAFDACSSNSELSFFQDTVIKDGNN